MKKQVRLLEHLTRLSWFSALYNNQIHFKIRDPCMFTRSKILTNTSTFISSLIQILRQSVNNNSESLISLFSINSRIDGSGSDATSFWQRTGRSRKYSTIDLESLSPFCEILNGSCRNVQSCLSAILGYEKVERSYNKSRECRRWLLRMNSWSGQQERSSVVIR